MLRFVSLAGFAIICYLDYKKGYFLCLLISIPGIVLFNPFFKITFKKEIWQAIDEAIAYLLIVWSLAEWAYWFYTAKKMTKQILKDDELYFDHSFFL